MITFSSLRGSPRMAEKLPSPFAERGTSSCTPPLPIFSAGPTDPSGFGMYKSGRIPGPPPNTESRSRAGVRVLGEVSGLAGSPSSEVWSKVMSWSVNWPTNVEPAVMVGLSGLVPYGLLLVGLPLTAGSTISAFGPAARSSCASMMPPCVPTSSSAERTVSVAAANGGRPGNIRPKSILSAGVPGERLAACDATPAARAVDSKPGSTPADAAAIPAPASPAPLRSRRRDTLACSLPAISIPLVKRHSYRQLADFVATTVSEGWRQNNWHSCPAWRAGCPVWPGHYLDRYTNAHSSSLAGRGEPRRGTDLGKDRRHVMVHGALGDDQPPRDLLIRQALRQQRQHFLLACGKAGRSGPRGCPRTARDRGHAEFLHPAPGRGSRRAGTETLQDGQRSPKLGAVGGVDDASECCVIGPAELLPGDGSTAPVPGNLERVRFRQRDGQLDPGPEARQPDPNRPELPQIGPAECLVVSLLCLLAGKIGLAS